MDHFSKATDFAIFWGPHFFVLSISGENRFLEFSACSERALRLSHPKLFAQAVPGVLCIPATQLITVVALWTKICSGCDANALLVDDSFGDDSTLPFIYWGLLNNPRTGNPDFNQTGLNGMIEGFWFTPLI